MKLVPIDSRCCIWIHVHLDQRGHFLKWIPAGWHFHEQTWFDVRCVRVCCSIVIVAIPSVPIRHYSALVKIMCLHNMWLSSRAWRVQSFWHVFSIFQKYPEIWAGKKYPEMIWHFYKKHSWMIVKTCEDSGFASGFSHLQAEVPPIWFYIFIFGGFSK